MNTHHIARSICSAALVASLGFLGACGSASSSASSSSVASTVETVVVSETPATQASSSTASTSTASTSSAGLLDTTDLFTTRDLAQTADTSAATTYALTDGQVITITEEGVYVLTGTASEVTVNVAAADDAKVQIVLSGVAITNSSSPVINVTSADKVFVTTASGTTNTLSVTGSFGADANAVIYSASDLALNGQGTLAVNSTDKGIKSKDDLKVTGGSYIITSTGTALDANDRLAICDGSFTIATGADALHAENSDDATLGWIYISGGSFEIDATSDGVRGTSAVQIDGGTLAITAVEGIEATYVQLNGGTISIVATDDAINATTKSSAYTPTIEINGGELTVDMGAGDTDALDANGSIVINGGTVNITAQSAFDYDASGTINGGTVYVNGSQVTEMTNSMMGGGMGGGPMGGQGGGRQGR